MAETRSEGGQEPAATAAALAGAIDQHPRPVTEGFTNTPVAASTDGAGAPAASTDGAGHGAAAAMLAMAAAATTGPNGDEERYPNRIGNYHKGLPHNNEGEVDLAAYDTLLQAVRSGKPDDFEAITLGLGRKLTSPQAGLATDLMGPLPQTFRMRPAPALDTAEEAGEAVELYWMALLRDVPFTEFNGDAGIAQAAADLSALSDFRGPKNNASQVTPATIFRGTVPGDEKGPLLSQFLLHDIPYGSLTISQRQKTVIGGDESQYLTAWEPWLAVQNGAATAPDKFDGTRRYIRNMRDLGQYVHVDALYEAYLNACLILLGMNAPVDEGNPYRDSYTQIGFATFGGPHILSLVCEVATRALKAVWFQKWIVHRRLRPEAFGGLVHRRLRADGPASPGDVPLHADILNSQAVQETFNRYGTYLMPMAFPEGSPTHPAYGAGHATVAGACVTILKAWFHEQHAFTNPVVPNASGTGLVSYTGPDAGGLTIGGELNKVASNIGIGRNMAGVHWRSDYIESMRLGEEVALYLLKEQSTTYNEENSFTLTRFDGSRVTIKDGKITDTAGNRLYHQC